MNPKELLGETEYNEYKKAYKSLSKEIPELQGFSIEHILSSAIENKLIEKSKKEKPECETIKKKRRQRTRVCCGPYGSPYPNFAYFPITHSQTITVSSSDEVIQVLIKKLHTGAWITIWMGKEGEINLSEGDYVLEAYFKDNTFAWTGKVRVCVTYEF